MRRQSLALRLCVAWRNRVDETRGPERLGHMRSLALRMRRPSSARPTGLIPPDKGADTHYTSPARRQTRWGQGNRDADNTVTRPCSALEPVDRSDPQSALAMRQCDEPFRASVTDTAGQDNRVSWSQSAALPARLALPEIPEIEVTPRLPLVKLFRSVPAQGSPRRRDRQLARELAASINHIPRIGRGDERPALGRSGGARRLSFPCAQRPRPAANSIGLVLRTQWVFSPSKVLAHHNTTWAGRVPRPNCNSPCDRSAVVRWLQTG